MSNTLTFTIDNCKDCKHHCTERIYTADSFEHETGLYCTKVKDVKSPNKKYKLVAEDDYNVEEYSKIPDWCPLLDKNKEQIKDNTNLQ